MANDKMKPRYKPTVTAMKIKRKKELIIEELAKSSGMIVKSCEKVGICRASFYKWIKEDPVFAQAVDDIEFELVEHVEDKLLTQINKGDINAIKLFMQYKGKKKGYVKDENVNVTITGDVKFKFGNIIENKPNTDDISNTESK